MNFIHRDLKPDNILNNCPYIIEVCESVKSYFDYNFAVFRLMLPWSSLAWHSDTDCFPVAYHIPVKTNDSCFYVYHRFIFPMQEPGRLYSVLNQKAHTFINAKNTPRLHLHFIHDTKGDYINEIYIPEVNY